MSNIYVQEPPTSGKVLLVTSVGDIDVELWSKETPLACRNFVQLCLEGYYDGTLFHRVVPNFIVQGGDPEGTGNGGESIYDKPFRDELHSRIRFVRRGLVAMANDGPDRNGSQFFFTLSATPDLTKKHTIFGRVGGDTVYNMLRLAEVEIDDNERPLYPHKIIRTQILVNPFDDIVPRDNLLKLKGLENNRERESQSKATKNFKLLSFGDEAVEDEEDLTKGHGKTSKSKSSHDLLKDQTLSSASVLDEIGIVQEPSKDLKTVTESIRNKLKRPAGDVSLEEDGSTEKSKRNETKWQQNEQKSLKNSKHKEAKEPDIKMDAATNISRTAVNEKAKPDRKSEDRKSKLSIAEREAKTLALLQKFKSKLDDARQMPESSQSKDNDDDDVDKDDDSWMNHKLQFDEHSQQAKYANIHELERYEIFDPRNPIAQRRREASKQIMKEKGHSKH